MSAQNGLVQRLWSYCNVLRDDGLAASTLSTRPRRASSRGWTFVLPIDQGIMTNRQDHENTFA